MWTAQKHPTYKSGGTWNSKITWDFTKKETNVSLESDECGDDYDPHSDSKTDKASHREKLLVQDQEVEIEMCDSTFRFQSGLRAHVKLSPSGQFKCPQCTYLYEDKDKLREHIVFRHAPTEDSTGGEEPGDESQTENLLSKDKVNECKLCTPVFLLNSGLDDHIEQSHSEFRISNSPEWQYCTCRACKLAFRNKQLNTC